MSHACSLLNRKKENTNYVASLSHSNENGEGGKFIRQKNRFDTPFGDKEGELPVEANRYRLIWAPVCPWAHRSIIVRSLLGLEDVISVGTLDPVRPAEKETSDWAFTLDKDNVDPVLGIHYLSEIYLSTDPNYAGRPTVPCLVDLKTKKVANNDYFNLTKYFETKWTKYHKEGAPDLYPVELREEIDMDMRDSFNSSLEIKGYIVKNANEENQIKTELKNLLQSLKKQPKPPPL